MTGWRGAGNSISVGRHGSGGQYGGQLSKTLQPSQNQETGVANVSNTATLPNRGFPVLPAWNRTYDNTQPGRAFERAYGNPAIQTESRSISGGQSATVTQGAEASLSRRQPAPHVDALQPGYQETAFRGGVNFANDKLIAYDRHAVWNTGTERGGGRGSGFTDPPMDGPPNPALRVIQRAINWQVGNPLAHQDHEPLENRNYSHAEMLPPGYVPTGTHTQRRRFEVGIQYIGEQGAGWAPIYGGVPGMWQPYGSYAGITPGPVSGIQSAAPQGSLADGPQQVFSGVPHGLHSLTYPDYSSTLGRYMAIPQMSLPRQDRPSNATGAGQSFNQLVQPQGQTGTTGVQRANSSPAPGAIASQAWRGPQSIGWRGIRPGGGQV